MLQLLFDPDPEPLWCRAFLRALEDGFPADSAFGVLTLADLEDADGNVPHLSDVEASDETLGAIQAVIRRWPSGLLLGFDPSFYRLPLPRYEIDVEDPGGALAAILTGDSGRDAYNTTIQIRLGHLNVVSGMWPTVWRGILADWGAPEPNVLRLVCQHDRGWLEAPLAKHRVRAGDFPYAHANARGAVLPIALGTFDSRAAASSVSGAVRCLYLDTRSAERLFVPQLGVSHAIPRVYLNGTLATEATDYDLAVESISGFDFRTIRWLLDPGADPEVWCDLTGLEDVGDGTGQPIQTLAHQVRHLLVNFGFSDWRSGTWIDPSSAPVNMASFEEVGHYLAGNRLRPRGRANNWTQGRRTAVLVDTQARGLDVLNRLCIGAGVYPYWDEEGRIALAVVDHRNQRTYFEGSHWVRDEDLLEDLRQVPSVQRLRDEFAAEPLAAKDSFAGHEAAEDIQLALAEQPIHEADLVPYETTDEPTAWTTVTPGDPHESIDDPPYVPDDAATRATWDAASATGTFRVRVRWSDRAYVPTGHSVVAVVLHWRARYVANGGGAHTMKAGVYVGGVAYYSAAGDRTLTTSWVDYEDTFRTNPDTGEAWTMDDLGVDLLQLIVSATHTASQDKPEITQLFARVYLVAEGAAGDLVRERLTRELLMGRRPPNVTEVLVGLHRAAMAPGDPCSVSGQFATAPAAYATAAPDGWGVETWQRRPHVMAARYLDLGGKQARLRLIDARDLFVPMYEVDQARSVAPQAQGAARLGSWRAGRAGQPGGRLFYRPTDSDGDPTGIVTMTGPHGDTVTVPADTERYGPAGIVFAELSGAGPAVRADRLVYPWRHDAQAWPIEGGTAVFMVGITDQWMFGLGSDQLLYDGTNLVFRRTVDGTDYDATITMSNGPTVVGLRWTPGQGGLRRLDADENEEDVPPYTLDLWALQGSTLTRATSVLAVAGHPCAPGSGAPNLWIGADVDGNSVFGGEFRWRKVWRVLLTDDEVASEMRGLA